MMETLYDDCYYYSSNMNNNVNQLKRKMTLDLDNKTSVIKKAKMLGGLQTPNKPEVLSSPDLHMLKLASPELERFIISNHSLVTTTPTQVFFPRNVTEEQELYAKGFADALAQLQNNNHGHSHSNNNNITNNNNNSVQQQQNNNYNDNESSNSSNDSMSESESNSSSSYTTNGQLNSLSYSNSVQHHPGAANNSANSNANAYYNPNIPVHVKEEPQTVPSVSTPPMSPIDMASQEKIKLERKRQRNRVAASKCRKRKLERISRLEDKVKLLKNENSNLTDMLSKLKDNVSHLKQQVMEHVQNGCQIMISSNMSSF